MKICSVPDCTSKSKGLGFCGRHYQAFKKTGDPLGCKTKNPSGMGNIRPDGYIRFSGKLKHRSVVEEVLGVTLLDTDIVHHKDGNPSNNDPENLLICKSIADHMRVHKEERALAISGFSHYRLCEICGEYDDPANMTKVKSERERYTHELCAKTTNIETAKRRREKRENERRIQQQFTSIGATAENYCPR
jgi:hypothetical protein